MFQRFPIKIIRVFYLFSNSINFLPSDLSPEARTCGGEAHEEEEASEEEEDCREEDVDNQSDGGDRERILQLVLNQNTITYCL